MKSKVREEMTKEFINSLKENIIPWEREWVGGERAFNPITGTKYKGTNAFWLGWKAYQNKWEDPRWCTFAQAQDNGWKIKPGEKGTKIEFFSPYDREEKRKITYKELRKLQDALTPDELKARISYPVANYTVFNAAQIEGIPDYRTDIPEWSVENVISARDNLLKNMNLDFNEGGDRAYYSPLMDSITLPHINNFTSEYGYLATMLHEAGHATGHESRLNRDLSNDFGTEGYAREELRAEIASAFTAQEIGLVGADLEHTNNHKAYIQNWISVLQNNPNELFKAIKEAEEISDYLLEKGEFEMIISETLDRQHEEFIEDIDNSYIYSKDKTILPKTDLEKEMSEYVKAHQEMLSNLKPEKIPVVINGYGGPGAGKSTACMNICAALKIAGYNAEYVQEYAKELVYEKNFEMLNGSPENQFKVLKEQTRRLDRLYDQVEFIVTDSPVLLNTIYNQHLTPEYSEMVKQLNSQYTNFSFFMKRDVSHFQEEGRIHNLEQSIEKDNEIKKLLADNDIYYGEYRHDTVDIIIQNAIRTYERINSENIKLEDLKNPYFEIRVEDKMLQLKFDGKPASDVRTILKNNKFRWNPEQEVWQRYMNDNAKLAAKNIIKEIEMMKKDNKEFIESRLKKTFDQREYDYDQLEDSVSVQQKEQWENTKVELSAEYTHDTENCLLTGSQAARFRMAMKGQEHSLKAFMNDTKIPSELKDDSIKVGKLVKEYLDTGMELKDIVSNQIKIIDEKADIGEPLYTKNLICSLYANTRAAYKDLKKTPDLWNQESMVNISAKLAERLLNEQILVVTDNNGTLEEIHNPKEFTLHKEREFYINKEQLNEVVGQYQDILPIVQCEFSEAYGFDSGKFYTLKEYDDLMRAADLEFVSGRENARAKYETEEAFLNTDNPEDYKYIGYQKNKFTVNFGDGRTITERQDIGDGEGGIIEHFENISSLKFNCESMKRSVEAEEEFNKLQEKIREVFQYEEENNIPEDFRTTSGNMEVISREMLNKQYELISNQAGKSISNENPVMEYLKRNIQRNSPRRSPGIEL